MSQKPRLSKLALLPAVFVLFSVIVLGVLFVSTAQNGSIDDPNEVEIPVSLVAFTLPAIQHDLALSQAQIAKITELDENLKTHRYAVRDANARKGLAEILDPTQLSRVKQLTLQGLGVRAFGVPEVVEKLGLSEQQKQSVADIRADLKLQLQPFQDNIVKNGSPKDYPAAIALVNDTDDMYKNAHAQALQLLTPKQRTIFGEIIGAPVNPQ